MNRAVIRLPLCLAAVAALALPGRAEEPYRIVHGFLDGGYVYALDDPAVEKETSGPLIVHRLDLRARDPKPVRYELPSQSRDPGYALRWHVRAGCIWCPGGRPPSLRLCCACRWATCPCSTRPIPPARRSSS